MEEINVEFECYITYLLKVDNNWRLGVRVGDFELPLINDQSKHL